MQPKQSARRLCLRGPVLLDVESRGRAKLRDVGGRRYWDCPTSEMIVSVLADTATGEVHTWRPGDPSPQLGTAVAHNWTGFDRFAAARYGWTWDSAIDSAHCAAKSGLPRKLEETASRLLGRHKDHDGSALTKSLSRPSRAKATFGQLPELTSEVLARVTWYCADDVEVISDAWEQLEPWAEVDADVGEADREINDRGIRLDVDLVKAMQELQRRQQEQAVEAAARELGWSVADTRRIARSPAAFAAETGLPNAKAETTADTPENRKAYGFLLDHALVRARRALASIVPGKLVAALNRVSEDGRLRDVHWYMGAHTGRWSSKGVQLHNLTRVELPEKGEAAALDRLIAACHRGLMPDALLAATFPKAGKRTADALLFAALIRASLTSSDGGVLSVLDYSGIEARCSAWAAGDRKALEVFKAFDAGKGPDPYCVMAGSIFGRPISKKNDPEQRQVGKAAELMLGYQAGADKFAFTCESQGTDLAAVGVDAGEVVQAWRELHKPIVDLWYACERAFLAAVEGKRGTAGPWVYERHGKDVWCVLPSGRPLVYRDAQAKRVERMGRRGKYQTWRFSYMGQKNGVSRRIDIYGGMFVENAVQATCRDLLADAIVRCNADGLDPVLHVHDELVCDVRRDCAAEAHAYQRNVMMTPPDWARGLPITVSGFCEERYRK